MPGKHATFSPSSSPSWMACAGYINAILSLSEEERDTSSPAALEGSCGHYLIANALEGASLPSTFTGQEVFWDEDAKEPAVLVTEDLAAASDTCVAKVRERVAYYEALGFHVEARVEQRVYPGKLFVESTDECWGSGDVILIISRDNVVVMLEIIDHKLGSGVWVEANSSQLALYGLGVVAEHASMHPDIWPTGGVRTTIIQPRHHLSDPDDPCRSHDWGRDDMELFRLEVSAAYKAAKDPNAKRTPGETQCRFCPYRAHCPELKQYALREATSVFQNLSPLTVVPDEQLLDEKPYLQDPAHLDAQTTSKILDVTPLVRSWLNAVEAHAQKEALKGVRYPGRKLVQGRRSYDFADEVAVAKALQGSSRTKDHGGKKLVKADFTESKLMSVAQIRKRLKPSLAPKTWAKVEAQIVETPGKPVLAPMSDPRAEYKVAAEQVFEVVTAGFGEVPETPVNPDNPFNLPGLD